jgi:hypothetical protein
MSDMQAIPQMKVDQEELEAPELLEFSTNRKEFTGPAVSAIPLGGDLIPYTTLALGSRGKANPSEAERETQFHTLLTQFSPTLRAYINSQPGDIVWRTKPTMVAWHEDDSYWMNIMARLAIIENYENLK